MDYARWANRYEAIRAEFGYPFEREEEAERLLAGLLPAESLDGALERISTRLAEREVVVVGLAPGVGAPPVWTLPKGPRRPAIVAADGATRICLEAGLTPDVVVTDLDGPVPSEVAANAAGALVLIHAHGDNLRALERWVPEFTGELAGSWAGPPRDGLLDVGGFTDGDRSVYLAEHVGAARILLWGFDFRRVDPAGAGPAKLRKLAWAERLIRELAEQADCPVERWDPDGRRTPYGEAETGPSTQ
ncbi:MAG TPA: 6-hydroxymethylpterin diphosphokinase MptE-like protein [Thermoplasmata archaeon]|nr:6-hydroxymethylpterin diphosphokinase MptE-like protein [Thermoplasmata archaeon]